MHRSTSRAMLVALAVVGAAVPATAQSMSNDKAMADKNMASNNMMMAPKGGTFTGAKGHSASGTFTITGSGKDRKLEFSDSFKADKAPDSYVILAKGAMADGPGSLELGKLKKDTGAQSYKIPESADLSSFSSVVIWSKGHSMAVGQASLASGAMDHGSMGTMAKDSGMMKKP